MDGEIITSRLNLFETPDKKRVEYPVVLYDRHTDLLHVNFTYDR